LLTSPGNWLLRGLTQRAQCSTFVPMEVETLGKARSLAWKVHMRCVQGYREETRSMRRCVYRRQLDLDTLVCTRGPNFPLSRLESRLMCPACGSPRVTVVSNRRAMRRWGVGDEESDRQEKGGQLAALTQVDGAASAHISADRYAVTSMPAQTSVTTGAVQFIEISSRSISWRT
jgi:hypothetical protein